MKIQIGVPVPGSLGVVEVAVTVSLERRDYLLSELEEIAIREAAARLCIEASS